MDNIIKQLKNGAKHTRLSFSEKSEMRSALLQYAKDNPVAAHPRLRSKLESAYSAIPSPFSFQNFRNKKMLPILVIAGLLVGSSVSFAAEGAIPGDTLYPVKLHINEKIRGAIAVTPKAKALWEVRVAERRLEEVEKLNTETNVSTDSKLIAEQNFRTYSERVKDSIKRFKEEDDQDNALEVSGQFSEMLHKHENTLRVLGEEGKYSSPDSESTRSGENTSRIFQSDVLIQDKNTYRQEGKGDDGEKTNPQSQDKRDKERNLMPKTLPEGERKVRKSIVPVIFRDINEKVKKEEIRSSGEIKTEQSDGAYKISVE